jgi:KH domain
VAGVADAIHIATYYIGNILIEAQERMPSYSNSSYRPTSARRQPYMGSSYVPSYSNPYGQGPPPPPPPHHNPPQQLQTQQIYIPNDLVGCIIGKGGSKINEIRHMSASQIKIMEPGAVGVGMNGAPAPAGGEGERLVVITGQPANIQMAVQLLYHVSLFVVSALKCFLILAASATGARETETAPCPDRECVTSGIFSSCPQLSILIVTVAHLKFCPSLCCLYLDWYMSPCPCLHSFMLDRMNRYLQVDFTQLL